MKAVLIQTQGPHPELHIILGDIEDAPDGKPPGHLANIELPSMGRVVEFASLVKIKGPIAYYREAFAKPTGRLGQTMESFHPEQK